MYEAETSSLLLTSLFVQSILATSVYVIIVINYRLTTLIY